MVILFDIDNTLLDTKAFVKRVFAHMQTVLEAEHAISAGELSRLKDEYYHGLQASTDFSPEDFVSFLSEEGPVVLGSELQEKLIAFFYEKNTLEQHLFSDVTRNLQRLSVGNTLGIFSQGIEKYQSKKIDNSGLMNYFDTKYRFVYKRKETPEVLSEIKSKIHGDFSVIDDKFSAVSALAFSGVKPVFFLDRLEQSGPLATQMEAVKVIKTLDEVQV